MESLQGVADAIAVGSLDGSDIGKRIVLPASHTDGRLYMKKNYHDAIAIYRVYGPLIYLLLSCVILSGQKFPTLYGSNPDSAALIELILLIGFTI